MPQMVSLPFVLDQAIDFSIELNDHLQNFSTFSTAPVLTNGVDQGRFILFWRGLAHTDWKAFLRVKEVRP